MILVFGGTTEGRIAAGVLDRAGKEFFYSTRSGIQELHLKNAIATSGAMNAETMRNFCRTHSIGLIVDAAHPFAAMLRQTISEVADECGIRVVRYERKYAPRDSHSAIWCDDYDDALRQLESHGIRSLLALTGVQTIGRLRPFWERHSCTFRILDRDESRRKALESGFPLSHTVYYDGDDSLDSVIRRISPDAIITKESGESGGFDKKAEAALSHNLKLFVVKRPPVPENFIIVTGEHTLRRAVEQQLPGFFDLRSGVTTGACACAAAKAALLALTDEPVDSVDFLIPSGETLRLAVTSTEIDGRRATATVIKDAGDDPDVTDGCTIMATVEPDNTPGIKFRGGEGVGIVTLPGLGIEPGEPAINPVPRKMISDNLSAIYPGGLTVTISVPEGAELAKRTFNPRVGVVGGISIIGTSGIVRPFSHEAFMEAIRREMEVAVATGTDTIVLNSGAKSENAMKRMWPQMPAQAFIHYGNAIGDTLRLACEMGVENIIVGVMIGKAVKLAEGNLDTHSHRVCMSHEFLCTVAAEAGCSSDALQAIGRISLARELWTQLSDGDSGLFFTALLRRCYETCRSAYKSGNLEMMLVADDDTITYRTK